MSGQEVSGLTDGGPTGADPPRVADGAREDSVPPAANWTVRVKPVNVGTNAFDLEVPVGSSDSPSVDALRRQIELDGRVAVPDGKEMRLVFRGQVLRDGRSLASYGAANRTAVMLMIRDAVAPAPPPAVAAAAAEAADSTNATAQAEAAVGHDAGKGTEGGVAWDVAVKPMGGEQFTVTLDGAGLDEQGPDARVLVDEVCKRSEGHDVRVIFRGKVLRSGKKLGEYGIRPSGSVVHVVRRLPGGERVAATTTAASGSTAAPSSTPANMPGPSFTGGAFGADSVPPQLSTLLSQMQSTALSMLRASQPDGSVSAVPDSDATVPAVEQCRRIQQASGARVIAGSDELASQLQAALLAVANATSGITPRLITTSSRLGALQASDGALTTTALQHDVRALAGNLRRVANISLHLAQLAESVELSAGGDGGDASVSLSAPEQPVALRTTVALSTPEVAASASGGDSDESTPAVDTSAASAASATPQTPTVSATATGTGGGLGGGAVGENPLGGLLGSIFGGVPGGAPAGFQVHQIGGHPGGPQAGGLLQGVGQLLQAMGGGHGVAAAYGGAPVPPDADTDDDEVD